MHAGRDPLTGRKTYVQRTVRGTKHDAENALARLVTAVNDGAHSTKKSGTVGELLEQWFSHNEADWSPLSSATAASSTGTSFRASVARRSDA